MKSGWRNNSVSCFCLYRVDKYVIIVSVQSDVIINTTFRKRKAMIIILYLCMLLVPWIMGNGVLYILYRKYSGKDFSVSDALLTGWIAVIGIAEMTQMSAVVLHFSLTRCTVIFGVLIGLMTIVSLIMYIIRRIKKGEEPEKKTFEKSSLLILFSAALFLSQIAYILLSENFYLSRDMTLETVVSFLYTDGIYQVNPLTGAAYEGGIPLRLEILCLPTLYSMLCRLFSLAPRTVVWLVMPCVMLLCCCSAFRCVGRCLFPDSAKRQGCFLATVAVLLWVGSYAFGMDGFGVLYSGWRGVTIRNTVLIPYLISLCMRRKWKLVVLCIAAEACLVWTFYGAGVCLLTAVGLTACELIWRRTGKTDRKEAAE